MYFSKSLILCVSLTTIATATPSRDHSLSSDVSPTPNLLPRGQGVSSQQVSPEASRGPDSGPQIPLYLLPGSSVLARSVWCKSWRRIECERHCYCPDKGHDMKCDKESHNALWKTAKLKAEIARRRVQCGATCLCAPSSAQIAANPDRLPLGNKVSTALNSVGESSHTIRSPPSHKPLDAPANALSPPADPSPHHPEPWFSPAHPMPLPADPPTPIAHPLRPPANPFLPDHNGRSLNSSASQISSHDVLPAPKVLARDRAFSSFKSPSTLQGSDSSPVFYIECRGRFRDRCEGICECTSAGNVACSNALEKRRKLPAGQKRCGEDCDCQLEPPDPSRKDAGINLKISSVPAKVLKPLQGSHRPHLIARGQMVSTVKKPFKAMKKPFKTKHQSTASLPHITCEGPKQNHCEMFCWCDNKSVVQCSTEAHLNLQIDHRTTKSLPSKSWLTKRECNGLCACHAPDFSDSVQPPSPIRRVPSEAGSDGDVSSVGGSGSVSIPEAVLDPFASLPMHLGQRSIVFSDSAGVSKAPKIQARGLALSCLKSPKGCSSTDSDLPSAASGESWGNHPVASENRATLRKPRASQGSRSPTTRKPSMPPQPPTPDGPHTLTAANLRRLSHDSRSSQGSATQFRKSFAIEPQFVPSHGYPPINPEYFADLPHPNLPPLKIGRSSSIDSLKREWLDGHSKLQARGLQLSCLRSPKGCLGAAIDPMTCVSGYQQSCDLRCACIKGSVTCKERSSPCYEKCRCGLDPSDSGLDAYGSHPERSGNIATLARSPTSRFNPSPLGPGSSDRQKPSLAQSLPHSQIKSMIPFQRPYFSKRGLVQSCLKGSETCDGTALSSLSLAPPLVCQGPHHSRCMINCFCIAVGQISCTKRSLVDEKSLIHKSHLSHKEARKRAEENEETNTEICTAACTCRQYTGGYSQYPKKGDTASLQRPSSSPDTASREPSDSMLSTSEIAAMDYGKHPARGNFAIIGRPFTPPGHTSRGETISSPSHPGQIFNQLSRAQSSPGRLSRVQSPLGPSALVSSTLSRSSSIQISPTQSSSSQAFPSQTSSGQASPGQVSSGQASSGQTISGQTSPGQTSPDTSHSKALSEGPRARSLSKRGGGQSHLSSPDGSSSGGSTDNLFTLQCNVRYQDSCDIHCRCDEAQQVVCDKRSDQTVKGLSRNFGKGWVRKGVREQVAKTTKRCRERCQCVNNSPEDPQGRSKSFHRALLASKLLESTRLQADSGVSRPRQMIKRGGLNSCLKSSSGCSSDTSATRSTLPPGRVINLRCDDSSHQSEFDADCYCTDDRTVKCDARFHEHLSKVMPGLRNAYMGKHHATNVLRDEILQKEIESRKWCRCEEGPLETSPGPTTVHRGSVDTLTPSQALRGLQRPSMSTGQFPPYSDASLSPRHRKRGGVLSNPSSNSEPPSFEPKAPSSEPRPIFKDPRLLERGQTSSSLIVPKSDTLQIPLISPPTLRLLPPPHDLRLQCFPRKPATIKDTSMKEITLCTSHCSCLDIGKPQCNVLASEMISKMGSGSRGLSAQQEIGRMNAGAAAIMTYCHVICSCTDVKKPMATSHADFRQGHPAREPLEETSSNASGSKPASGPNASSSRLLERGHTHSSLGLPESPRGDTIKSPLIRRPIPPSHADLKLQCVHRGRVTNREAIQKELATCSRSCGCSIVGKPECAISAYEIMSKMGAAGRLSVEGHRNIVQAGAEAIATHCQDICSCVDVRKPAGTFRAEFREGHPAHVPLSKRSLDASLTKTSSESRASSDSKPSASAVPEAPRLLERG